MNALDIAEITVLLRQFNLEGWTIRNIPNNSGMARARQIQDPQGYARYLIIPVGNAWRAGDGLGRGPSGASDTPAQAMATTLNWLRRKQNCQQPA